MELAPVILFAYNRPEHTRKTLIALSENVLADKSELFIFIDGPKSKEQSLKTEEVRKIAEEKKWCSKVNIIVSDFNKGLAVSVTKGVTEIVNKYGKAIVLEDDHISDKWFLKFMNDALNVYESDDRVACISGYIYPVKGKLPGTFFLKGADCWGWATWKRSWDILDLNGEKLLKQLEEQEKTADFNFYDSYPYVQMLKDQIAKKNNSWAILWYASAYLKNKYCLYPGHSLIHNIGVDGSGTHSGTTEKFDVNLQQKENKVEKMEVSEKPENKKIIAEYFRSLHKAESTNLLKRILKKIGG